MNGVVWLLRLGLAGVFVYAGVVKLGDPSGFAEEIAGYRLAPGAVGRWTAVYLPWLEVVIGVGVLLPWTVRGAAMIQAGLMVVFIVALSSAWWRGLDITCGCFGGGGEPADYGWLIGRDVVLLVGAGWVWVGTNSGGGAEPVRADGRMGPNK
ncbi:MAG: MauE/DoxX family redox-associated membrane protein [Planctomycetota bacterium]